MQDRTEVVNSLINQLKLACPPNVKPILVKLEAEFERQTTEIETLAMVSAMPIAHDKWVEAGLTASEAKILRLLEKADTAGMTKLGIFDALYGARQNPPDLKIIDVLVCKARRQIERKDLPCWVETIWGVGYRLHQGRAPRDFIEGRILKRVRREMREGAI